MSIWNYLTFNHFKDQFGKTVLLRFGIWKLGFNILITNPNDPTVILHNHPYSFYTFPLFPWGYTDYILNDRGKIIRKHIPGWKWTYKPFYEAHRFIGPGKHLGKDDKPKTNIILTLVWNKKSQKKDWGLWMKKKDAENFAKKNNIPLDRLKYSIGGMVKVPHDCVGYGNDTY